MKTKIIEVTTEKQIDKLGSAITIEGISLGKDGHEAVADWCDGLAKFKEAEPKAYLTKGRTMNMLYGLTGDNAYPDNCNIVSFDLDDFENYEALIMPRFRVGMRWLDDIVSNNLRRQCA